jgi:hypothetical protein
MVMCSIQDCPVIIGCFYETGKGVAYVYGGGSGNVNYYYDDDNPSQSCTYGDCSKWVKLAIRDFPNARDPRLPYDFDLHFDIKYMSQLKMQLAGELDWCHDMDYLHELIAHHGIKV